MEPTAVIIVNWNGWKDTIECLESFSFAWENLHFFIVDNASTDGSVERLIQFCKTNNIVHKVALPENLSSPIPAMCKVTIVKNNYNAGFARANNLVLKFILPLRQFNYAWLLNNDTIVRRESLLHLQEKFSSDASLAFCGSVLLDYYDQQLVQCAGVNHFKYLGVSKLFLKNTQWSSTQLDPQLSSSKQTYQNGASLLVDVDKLNAIGLLDEDYFLYSEEADWQIRAGEKGFHTALAEKSVVYHKGSVSTNDKKHVFFYHYNRSAILLTRKHFGALATLTASFSLLVVTLIRSRFKPSSFGYGLKGIYNGLTLAI
jgi:GT2 family glycosyltransferase